MSSRQDFVLAFLRSNPDSSVPQMVDAMDPPSKNRVSDTRLLNRACHNLAKYELVEQNIIGRVVTWRLAHGQTSQ